MTEPILDARGITVQYGGIVALDAIDFTAGEHAITGLVGPERRRQDHAVRRALGAGAAACRTGAARRARRDPRQPADVAPAWASHGPSSGSSCSASSPCASTSSSPHRVRERRDRALWRDLIGRGSRPAAGEDETVDGILSLLGLDDVAERPVTLLPLGTGRVVEIAVGRSRLGPRVVLLDEPTSGLDVHETELLATALRRARDERASRSSSSSTTWSSCWSSPSR